MFSDVKREHKRLLRECSLTSFFPFGRGLEFLLPLLIGFLIIRRNPLKMLLNYKGRTYEIINWPEFRKKVLFLLGEGIVNAIQDEALKLGLYISGRYIRGFHHYVDNDGELNIDNDVYYAKYLEYGTFEYFDLYGLDNFPDTPIKKKDLSREERASLPKGMAPFAPIRRVLYNQEKINQIIKEQFG